ncbi:hypothetical protein [Aureimonas sp. ME7]|uniref:hypothetical protein n=1 Tax=Aureimonas sp. ME7 TaxID=2744252 RepID=UPI0015F44B56|nr:hypothetical protein [Aureimonas sp. ME7]
MMSNATPKSVEDHDEVEEAQLKHQFADVENDLVDVETFTEKRPEDDLDETSAGGLQYPPDVKTSGGGEESK